MVCLEDFYKTTGFSRSFFGEVIEVSPSTLKKYEWSNTDNMRRSTIEKIEEGAKAILDSEIQVHVCPPGYFCNSPIWVVTWKGGKYRGNSIGLAKMVRGIAGLL